MNAYGDYYSYYMANDYLAHHGVLGMKWGQHIFGKDKQTRGTRKRAKAKRPLFESKEQRREREKQERIARDRKLNAQMKKFHEKEKIRRSKMSKSQALDDLKFIDRLVKDTASAEDYNKYEKMIDEITRSVYDRSSMYAPSEAGKKLNQIMDKQIDLHAKMRDTLSTKRFNELLEQDKQLDDQFSRLLTKEMGYKYDPEIASQLEFLYNFY